MGLKFETDFKTILAKMDRFDPSNYVSTRNFVDGNVSYLSPYISRGVISTRQVLKNVLEKGYKIPQIEQFVKELCWRDYFQRVGQVKNPDLAIKQEQVPIANHEISSLIMQANTGIEGIDTSIKRLYQTGYMHNHCRMYTASVVCNIAGSHWHHPAQWMYYHLLDGDWASNACSWQWVAGANGNKKYYANQENINIFTSTNQRNTFLDKPRELLEAMNPPSALVDTQKFSLAVELPETSEIWFDSRLPTFIYNYYNLDPLWHKDEPGNRILLIEPEFFEKYPVSKKCINFMLALSENIEKIQIFKGSFQTFIQTFRAENFFYKEHPLNFGYSGNREEREWIINELQGYYPSFFAYWKQAAKYLQP